MKYQTIAREYLSEIYNKVCNDWKIIICDTILKQTGNFVSFPEDLIQKGYSEANFEQKELIKKHFNIQDSEEIFRVRNYSELCKVLNIEELSILDFKRFENGDKLLALHQIKTIEKAYNGDWKPDFDDKKQKKYIPYFIKDSSGWRLDDTDCYYDYFNGVLGLYKSEEIAKFVGERFMDIYLRVI